MVQIMQDTVAAAVSGFAMGMSLIVAIGAQNTFVLRQGIAREHVFPIVVICSLSDIALMCAGISGASAVATQYPQVQSLFTYGAAIFLACYGFAAAKSAFKGGGCISQGASQKQPLKTAVLLCLAFTWLNPHCWLDTMVLVGSMAATYSQPWSFGAGAMAASVVWFFGLGYGAKLLAKVFEKPAAWQVLDAATALIMLTLAASLIV